MMKVFSNKTTPKNGIMIGTNGILLSSVKILISFLVGVNLVLEIGVIFMKMVQPFVLNAERLNRAPEW